jgi:hypothetical protein
MAFSSLAQSIFSFTTLPGYVSSAFARMQHGRRIGEME